MWCGAWKRVFKVDGVQGAAHPAARKGHSFVPAGDEDDTFLLFGGTDEVDVRADTWKIALGGDLTWRRVDCNPVARTPPKRKFHVSAHVRIGERSMLAIMGGENLAVRTGPHSHALLFLLCQLVLGGFL